MRNAIMSGYGLATVVIEAKETSGTRIQARLALEHGRPVILASAVAQGTEWGHSLARRPGVHVVGSLKELEQAIDLVTGEPLELKRALHRLAGDRSHPAA